MGIEYTVGPSTAGLAQRIENKGSSPILGKSP